MNCDAQSGGLHGSSKQDQMKSDIYTQSKNDDTIHQALQNTNYNVDKERV